MKHLQYLLKTCEYTAVFSPDIPCSVDVMTQEKAASALLAAAGTVKIVA